MWRRKRRREEPAEIYGGLRRQVIDLDPADAGLEPSDALPEVWGAMMEMGIGPGIATLVGLADGTTSLYLSTGGGTIGGGEHEAVAERTRAFLAAFEPRQAEMPPEDEARLPAEGEVVLRALTYSGRRAVAVSEDELGEGSHPLSPVFFAGHDVITALRQIDEQR